MIDVEKLRQLAAALNRAEDKYPNGFYVGFGAAILEAIGDQPTNDIDATGQCCCADEWVPDLAAAIVAAPAVRAALSRTDTEETPP